MLKWDLGSQNIQVGHGNLKLKLKFSEAYSKPNRVSEMGTFAKLFTVFFSKSSMLMFKWVLNTLVWVFIVECYPYCIEGGVDID